MEIADVLILISENYAEVRNKLNVKLNGDFEASLKSKFLVPCSVVYRRCFGDIESEIKERLKKTEQEGRLYLSVGLFDLVDTTYIRKKVSGSKTKYRIPSFALALLEKEIKPFFETYYFRSVLVTNVFNFIEWRKKDCKNPLSINTLNDKKKRLETLIEEVEGTDYVIQKIDRGNGGEGEMDDAKIDEAKNKLCQLIETIREEIKDITSSDYMQRRIKTHACKK